MDAVDIRRKALDEKRRKRLSTTTKEQRIENMKKFVSELSHLGERNFQNETDKESN